MDFVDEIENLKRTTFSVTNIPVGNLKEFKELCKEEYGNVYYVGIIQLMKTKKLYEQIVPLLSSLIQELKKGGKICQN